MRKKLLLPLLLLPLLTISCDEDEPGKTDARVDARIDAALFDARDVSLNEVPATEVRAEVTADGVDSAAPDGGTDAPIDSPAGDLAVDQAIDVAVDSAPDQAIDATPDTSPDRPEAGLEAAEAGIDGSPTTLNGCTFATAEDLTAAAATRTITWNQASGARCLKIKEGQSVTWMGNLATHPLAQEGGDTGSPIQPTSTGTMVTVAFPDAGTFGYVCTQHDNMIGAIFVVP